VDGSVEDAVNAGVFVKRLVISGQRGIRQRQRP